MNGAELELAEHCTFPQTPAVTADTADYFIHHTCNGCGYASALCKGMVSMGEGTVLIFSTHSIPVTGPNLMETSQFGWSISIAKVFMKKNSKMCTYALFDLNMHLACHINYHHNFCVCSRECVYYHKIPDIIQVAKHQFVKRYVIELWWTDMFVAWKSAMNCTRSYQLALSKARELL